MTIRWTRLISLDNSEKKDFCCSRTIFIYLVHLFDQSIEQSSNCFWSSSYCWWVEWILSLSMHDILYLFINLFAALYSLFWINLLQNYMHVCDMCSPNVPSHGSSHTFPLCQYIVLCFHFSLKPKSLMAIPKTLLPLGVAYQHTTSIMLLLTEQCFYFAFCIHFVDLSTWDD